MRQLTGGLLLTLLAAACKTTAPVVQPTPPQPVLITLGNKSFTTDDFFQSYTKNQLSADSIQRTDIRNYVDLYTNLKLKVVAAEAQGRDTTEAFREEINTYRKQLAQSYLTDKVLVESLAAEAYQRMQQEVNASHLLIALSEEAAPADTLAAYQSALALRKQLQGGADFAQLARERSNDPLTAANGGNLGYFTAFSVVYPLETAAYETPVGQVSTPVRTRFGYHLVRVNDRRASRGLVKVAHILVRMSPGAGEAGQQKAQQRIDAAYARLQQGEAFETVCRDVSDDATSRLSGGVLPIVETGRQVPAFEEAAFALARPGEFSKPVKTNYGWHILKLIERRGIQPYADLAPSLRQRVTTDSRAEVMRQSVLQRLRKTHTVRPDLALLAQVQGLADSSLLRGQWRYTEPLAPALQNKTLVTVDNTPFSVNSFYEYVRQHQQPARNPNLSAPAAQPVAPAPNGSPAVAMQRQFDRFVGDKVLAAEENSLETKSPDFRALMSEIRDGVLLSQMMEQNVWERSIADSLGQKAYYEAHKADYQFPERVLATILTAPTDAVLKQAQEILAGKAPYALRRASTPLLFDRGQTALSAKSLESLYEAVAVLARNPDYVVELGGAHDPAERDSVSAGRIRNAVAYLRQNGVALSRIMEKDYQGVRPGEARQEVAQQRRLTLQYYSNAKSDAMAALNARTGAEPVTITEGLYAQGTEPLIDGIDPWKPNTTTVLHPGGKAVAVLFGRIEPARAKTFAEARGTVINAYQAQLEQQWMARLRQQYPVQLNEAELRKLHR